MRCLGMLVLGTALLPWSVRAADTHVIEIHGPVLSAEDGLMLGNGDLSVSVYQAADRIVWRFGKGDVWDRRLDTSDDPKPAHIDEFAHGLDVEGWKCPSYGGPGVATRGTDTPKRMQELCQGIPPSYMRRPFPCPKPVGELSVRLPTDLPGMTLSQRLLIEEARLLVECSWPCGLKITLESFVPPKPNVLAVRWKIDNWNEQTKLGDKRPLWFSLYRWADPSIDAFAEKFFGEYRDFPGEAGEGLLICSNDTAKPLAPPSVKDENGRLVIEQTFPAELTFPEGFRYQMAPFVSPGTATESAARKQGVAGEARLHILPPAKDVEGQLLVAVATSSDAGGPGDEVTRIAAQLGDALGNAVTRFAIENRESAAKFWSQSSLRVADAFLENLWYAIYHAKRCYFRAGTVPPGIYLPTTVQDYSFWHGDYHTNFNVQAPYMGCYEANHPEIADAYFDALAISLPMARKIAKDYYGGRGLYIPLTLYPLRADDDYFGLIPMGRIAYMTSWATHQYWWRYRYTLDKDWLQATGYPVLRDAALFYTDLMKKRADGLYHIFPSTQEEDGLTGDPKDCTDRGQVMQHARYALRSAIQASEALGIDDLLRAEWQEHLDHMAGDDGAPPLVLEGLEKLCYERNPPEFSRGRPYEPSPATYDPASTLGRPFRDWSLYVGPIAFPTMALLRRGEFIGDRDLPALRDVLVRWQRPNGIPGAMAVAQYGRAGTMGETLGVTGPLQETMLQSWDGALRIFPAWPKDLDVRFEDFRAEGAFLVTAAWSQGKVAELSIHSEKGGPCRLYSPWPAGIRVTDSNDHEVQGTVDAYGRPEFATSAGATYRVAPR